MKLVIHSMYVGLYLVVLYCDKLFIFVASNVDLSEDSVFEECYNNYDSYKSSHLSKILRS